MKLWNNFWGMFIKNDGIVQSFSDHWISIFLTFIGAFVVAKIIGGAAIIIAMLVAAAFAFFTHRADKRINGGDSAGE